MSQLVSGIQGWMMLIVLVSAPVLYPPFEYERVVEFSCS